MLAAAGLIVPVACARASRGATAGSMTTAVAAAICRREKRDPEPIPGPFLLTASASFGCSVRPEAIGVNLVNALLFGRTLVMMPVRGPVRRGSVAFLNVSP